MDIVVCIKQVPEAGESRFDPVTRRLDRTGVANVINPFDRRAIALAVDLVGRFGGSTVVITLGPPQARAALVEALASGIQRAVHLCDPAFAGSDTLATARALACAIRRLPHDLVVCGKYTVDGETGQVGPELATFLALPQVAGIRKLTVVPPAAAGEPETLEAERESDEGFERVTTTLPVLLTTAERLIQPIRVDPEALARAETAPVETWSATDLGLAPAVIGQSGSPTMVLELRVRARARPPAEVRQSSTEDHARALADLVARWRSRDDEGEPRRVLPATPPGSDDAGAVWVVAERSVDGAPTGATLELLGEAAWLARRLGGYSAAVVLDAAYPEVGRLAAHGADRVLWPDAPALARYAPETMAAALAGLLAGRQPPPYAVLFSASERGRDIAPRLAAALGLGLTGDCIGLDLDGDGRLLQIKPALGLDVVAPIWSRTTPQLATVRPGTFALPASDPTRPFALERIPIVLAPLRCSVVHESIVEVDPSWRRLDGARAVVGVGSGIGGPQALPLVRRFAGLLGAAVGATRRVTDRGWLPRQLQIGLTGRIIAPDLYVAVGVRGAPNHMIGVQGAGTIVALNIEARADIFAGADLGFVGDFRPLLERTCELLEAASLG